MMGITVAPFHVFDIRGKSDECAVPTTGVARQITTRQAREARIAGKGNWLREGEGRTDN